MDALASDWRAWQLAADPAPGREAFLAGWAGVPAECRGGEWYLLAARALGRTPTRALEAGEVRLSTTREALERALEAEPEHPGVAAFLVFLVGVGADVPPLPARLCDRLAAGDDRQYVCGVAALAEGRADDGAAAFAAVAEPAAYPDLGLRWRQAIGTSAGLPPSVAHPPSEASCRAFGATEAECDRIRQEWKRGCRLK